MPKLFDFHLLRLAIVVGFTTAAADSAARSSSGVFCIRTEADQGFAERIGASGDMTFHMAGSIAHGNVYEVRGVAKRRAGRWRYQVNSTNEDERLHNRHPSLRRRISMSGR